MTHQIINKLYFLSSLSRLPLLSSLKFFNTKKVGGQIGPTLRGELGHSLCITVELKF